MAATLLQERPSPVGAFPSHGEEEVSWVHVFVDEMEPPLIGCCTFALTTFDETRVLDMQEVSRYHGGSRRSGSSSRGYTFVCYFAYRSLSVLPLQGHEGIVAILNVDAQDLR